MVVMKKHISIIFNCLLVTFSLWCNAVFAKEQVPSAYSARLVIDISGKRINAKVTVTNNSEEKALTSSEELGLYGKPSNSFTILKKSDTTKMPLRFRGSEAKRAPANNDEAVASQDTFDLDSLTNSFYVLQPDDFFILNVEPSFPKKKFLKLLSIPTTSNPLLQKKLTASDPTKPDDPVIITTDTNSYSN